MIAAGLAVAFVWMALLGTAYVSRNIVGAAPGLSGIAVVGCYLCLCVASLERLGLGWQGWAGAAGMLLPCTVAIIFCLR